MYAELTPSIQKGMFCNIKNQECLDHVIPEVGCEIASNFSEPTAKYSYSAVPGNSVYWPGVMGVFPQHSGSHTSPGHLFGLIAKRQQS